MPVLARCLPFLILFSMIPADASRGLAGEESDRFRHDLTVVLRPEDHHLEAEDVISVPSRALSGGSLHFVLHGDLQVDSADPDDVLEALPGAPRPEHFGIDEESLKAFGAAKSGSQNQPLADQSGKVSNQGQRALPAPLSVDEQLLFVEIYVLEVNRQGLAKSKTKAIEQAEQHEVPESENTVFVVF